MSLRTRDVAGAVLALAVAALFVRLGFWQLARLDERRAQNAIIAERRALPPVELPLHRLAADALRDRRAQARGVYDYAHERVWTGRTYDGAPGVALLTPLRLSDGSAVFVDRGWASSPDAAHLDRERYREGDTVLVEGLVLPAPRDRGDVDPVRLRDSVPYPLLPVVVQLDDTAAPHPVGLHRWRPPVLNRGPHLSYAIQWFSFALIVVVGTIGLLWKQR
ncbi:MAG TPA: SURF1 family protein [Gemmatimonadales bacterium]|nr:SURF1 family protein [Gemmatimonadales bacterium]